MSEMEKSNGDGVYYADGVEKPEGNPEATRRSHLFFGCCCDVSYLLLLLLQND